MDLIRSIQQRLGVKETGKVDSITEKAIRAFQKNWGIPVTGIIDSYTISALGVSDTVLSYIEPSTGTVSMPTPVFPSIKTISRTEDPTRITISATKFSPIELCYFWERMPNPSSAHCFMIYGAAVYQFHPIDSYANHIYYRSDGLDSTSIGIAISTSYSKRDAETLIALILRIGSMYRIPLNGIDHLLANTKIPWNSYIPQVRSKNYGGIWTQENYLERGESSLRIPDSPYFREYFTDLYAKRTKLIEVTTVHHAKNSKVI